MTEYPVMPIEFSPLARDQRSERTHAGGPDSRAPAKVELDLVTGRQRRPQLPRVRPIFKKGRLRS